MSATAGQIAALALSGNRRALELMIRGASHGLSEHKRAVKILQKRGFSLERLAAEATREARP